MPTYTATDFEPVPPGLCTAKLEKIEEATSQHGIYYRWCFVIEDEGQHEDRKVYANVSDKFGPQSKARRWCEQMVGRAIRKGEQFDTDALLGRSYHIMVSNTPEDVHRIQPKAEPNQEKAVQPENSEGDFENLPW
jgi:hypothetical protein